MEITLLIIRLMLFGVFAIAGAGKLLDIDGSEKAVRAFGVPGSISKPIGLLIPIAELIIAFLVLFVSTSWFGSIGTLLILSIFTVGMLWQLKHGNAPDCHCFGQIHSEPVGPKSLVRNLVIAAFAIVLAAAGRSGQGLPLGETAESIIQNLVLAVLSIAVVISASYLRRLTNDNRRLLRRIEFLEMLDNGGQPIERDEAGNPIDSLPIGAPFPDFQLNDTRNRVVTFEHLLADHKPKVFLFVGPNCEPCKALLPDFAKWRDEFGKKLRLVFVSSGSAADNLERFGEELSNGMLLQTNKELSNMVHCKWTPTALFVSADGNIAGHPAVGEAAIRDMFDRLKNEDFNKQRFYLSSPGKPGRIKIGQSVPEFSIEDLNERTITRENLVGRQTLAVFLSTTCSFCSTVADQIREWERSDTNGTQVIVFSEGDRSLHEEMGLRSSILIEPGYSTAIKLGMFGVPSGVLVDENGVIASETAVGGPAIWSLVGKYEQ